MSLFTDVKYLNQIGLRLPLFKRKGDYLYNCRCIICGDSSTKKNKARGYFYRQSNDLFYKCHNCDASQHFGTFLKNFDHNLYREYTLERYADGENRRPHAQPEFKFEAPVLDVTPSLPDIFAPVENSAEVTDFLVARKIPQHTWNRLLYIDNVKRLETLAPRYVNTIKTNEPRLVIPFYDANKQLIAVSCRALRDEALRYLTIKIKEDVPLIFGLERLDQSRKFYVTEGPLDSLFLDNCIAVGGTGFNRIESLNLNTNHATLIVDNQPRNAQVVKVYERLIDKGYKMLIWPEYTEAKDLNDLIKLGSMNQPLQTFIDINSHRNLVAQLKFDIWRKV